LIGAGQGVHDCMEAGSWPWELHPAARMATARSWPGAPDRAWARAGQHQGRPRMHQAAQREARRPSQGRRGRNRSPPGACSTSPLCHAPSPLEPEATAYTHEEVPADTIAARAMPGGTSSGGWKGGGRRPAAGGSSGVCRVGGQGRDRDGISSTNCSCYLLLTSEHFN
jgi:hypothetical protein